MSRRDGAALSLFKTDCPEARCFFLSGGLDRKAASAADWTDFHGPIGCQLPGPNGDRQTRGAVGPLTGLVDIPHRGQHRFGDLLPLVYHRQLPRSECPAGDGSPGVAGVLFDRERCAGECVQDPPLEPGVDRAGENPNDLTDAELLEVIGCYDLSRADGGRWSGYALRER